jgi:hypothetical protein
VTPIPECSACSIVEALEPCASELRALDHFPSVEEIDRVVASRAGVHFERAAPKGRRARALKKARQPIDIDTLYDGRIATASIVPTRPSSAHDLWNALVWSAFPRSKRAVHVRQHRLIANSLPRGAATLPPTRTREQDTIAMIDEGGVVLLCDPGAKLLIEAALEGRAKEALLDLKKTFTALVFGHAIYEELARGPKRVLGFSVIIETNERSRDRVVAHADERLSGMLAEPERFLSPEGHRGIVVEPDIFTL